MSKPISWIADYGGRIRAFRGELYLGYIMPALVPGHYIAQPCGAHAFVVGNVETALRILARREPWMISSRHT
jgi:hypothetical protein